MRKHNVTLPSAQDDIPDISPKGFW